MHESFHKVHSQRMNSSSTSLGIMLEQLPEKSQISWFEPVPKYICTMELVQWLYNIKPVHIVYNLTTVLRHPQKVASSHIRLCLCDRLSRREFSYHPAFIADYHAPQMKRQDTQEPELATIRQGFVRCNEYDLISPPLRVAHHKNRVAHFKVPATGVGFVKPMSSARVLPYKPIWGIRAGMDFVPEHGTQTETQVL
jgi:hypothetical protein